MAESAELKQMVMSLRVSELQVLLGYAGRNKHGRKHELLTKALQLLRPGCSIAVHLKIKELYRRRFPAKLMQHTELSHHQVTAKLMQHTELSHHQVTAKLMAQADMSHHQVTAKLMAHADMSHHPVTAKLLSHTELSHRPLSATLPGLTQLVYEGGAPSPALLPLSLLGPGKHEASPRSSLHPLHPDVTLQRLPFYDLLDELIKPTSLGSDSSQRFQETCLTFALTPQQVQLISSSMDISGTRCDFMVQVQLRFCLSETSCPQDDHFPPNLSVKVNGKPCTLPGYLPPTKSGVEPKRPSRPVNITSLVRLSTTVPNAIVVSWTGEIGRSYSLAVYLVRQQSSSVLLQRLRAKGIRNSHHSRALIKEKLTADPDSEIATTSLRVSLLCPLGKMRLAVPCRALTCSHLQCFDATLYLQMNEKKPTWVCPVCDKKAPYTHLIIDGLFVEILDSCSDCDEIQFKEDGSWAPMRTKREVQLGTVCYSGLDDSSGTSSSSGQILSSSSSSGQKVTVIDLTLDSSSEDDEGPESPAPECVGAPDTYTHDPVSDTHSHTHTQPLVSDTYSHTHTHKHTHTQPPVSDTYSHTHTQPPVSDTYSHTHTHKHTHTQPPVSDTYSHTQPPVSDTYSHTHTQPPVSDTYSHTQPPVSDTYSHTHTNIKQQPVAHTPPLTQAPPIKRACPSLSPTSPPVVHNGVLNLQHQGSPVSRTPSMPSVEAGFMPPVPPLIQDYRPFYHTPTDLSELSFFSFLQGDNHQHYNMVMAAAASDDQELLLNRFLPYSSSGPAHMFHLGQSGATSSSSLSTPTSSNGSPRSQHLVRDLSLPAAHRPRMHLGRSSSEAALATIYGGIPDVISLD